MLHFPYDRIGKLATYDPARSGLLKTFLAAKLAEYLPREKIFLQEYDT